jgi:hypothetical protein
MRHPIIITDKGKAYNLEFWEVFVRLCEKL